ncbi:F-box/kelch-repeat protein At3g23880-like [Rutidosis leptorrhynchoides]|uniref:F-box/kelch-repeat protein At3g23880-like n=1 Tax=Rutidosis leptorrhynchoides TaxID=125765 RepID=UPI003A994AB3
MPMKFPNGCYIEGSCNGIICLRDLCSNDVSHWNPSIRRKLDLPFHDYFRQNCNVVGFGFDSKTDDYKIIRLFYPDDYNRVGVFYPGCGEPYKSIVYSVKKRVWCEITPPSTHILRVRSRACFVNGVLHWVVSCYSLNEIILTFDLSTQLFSEIMLPEEPNRHTMRPIIFNFNGSLGMSFSNDYYTPIWAMKEYNNSASWYMVLKLKNFQFEGGVKAVLQLKNGNFLIRNYKNVYEVRYPKGGVCSEVCVRDSPTVDMVMYVESLALLDIGTVCINANQPYFTRKK